MNKTSPGGREAKKNKKGINIFNTFFSKVPFFLGNPVYLVKF